MRKEPLYGHHLHLAWAVGHCVVQSLLLSHCGVVFVVRAGGLKLRISVRAWYPLPSGTQRALRRAVHLTVSPVQGCYVGLGFHYLGLGIGVVICPPTTTKDWVWVWEGAPLNMLGTANPILASTPPNKMWNISLNTNHILVRPFHCNEHEPLQGCS